MHRVVEFFLLCNFQPVPIKLWPSVHQNPRLATVPLRFPPMTLVYEFSCGCEARYVGRTMQRLADRIKQHVPASIRKKSSTVREQPPRMCKNISSKINCESAIGQHLITSPECAKTYTDDNFRTFGQARSSFHLGVLESVSIQTQNPVLCRQKEFVFSLKLFN